jgi:hypothetical protein
MEIEFYKDSSYGTVILNDRLGVAISDGRISLIALTDGMPYHVTDAPGVERTRQYRKVQITKREWDKLRVAAGERVIGRVLSSIASLEKRALEAPKFFREKSPRMAGKKLQDLT